MEKKPLGRSGLNISRLVFGAWAIGGWMWGDTDEKDAIEAIHASLANGINTIDTAAVYGMGLSEELVGKAIKGKRDKVIIATKCGMRWDSSEGSKPWPQKDRFGKPVVLRNNSKPASIAAECEQSLKRLNIDVIDLYQIHWPDETTPIAESWQAMVKLKEQGKVRAIGVSNYSLQQLKLANAIHPVDSLQSPYSLIRRELEEDFIPFCKQNQITTLAYSPMERGLLTGKVAADRQFPPGDHRNQHPLFTPKNRQIILDALEEIRPIAEKYHATFAQIILKATLLHNAVDALLAGARNKMQAEENAKAALINLTTEEMKYIVDTLANYSQKLF